MNVKQEPGVAPALPAASTASNTAASNTTAVPTTATPTTSVDTKPNITATKSTPATDTTQRRTYQKSGNYNRQHIVPRLQVIYILMGRLIGGSDLSGQVSRNKRVRIL